MIGTTGPRLSVILPARNVEDFIQEALTSVLDQTFGDLEVVVIDDGSTDDTLAQIRAVDDARVVLVAREKGTGDLGMTLNLALDLARGEYVARMDGDDVCLPGRFAAQVAFLDNHPEIGLVGTWADFIDERGESCGTSRPPTEAASVAYRLHYESPFHHPSVMFRKSLVDRVGRYEHGKAFAEDYDLWARLAQVCGMANLDEVLLLQRVRSTSVSAQFPEGQALVADDVSHRMFMRTLGRSPSKSALRRMRTGIGDPASVAEASCALVDLCRAMRKTASAPERRAITQAAADALLQLWETSGRRAGLAPFLGALRVHPVRAGKLLPSAMRRLAG